VPVIGRDVGGGGGGGARQIIIMTYLLTYGAGLWRERSTDGRRMS